ncbi:MAG: hypothetical protein WKF83_13250 [Nocardioidaceae bacterium]
MRARTGARHVRLGVQVRRPPPPADAGGQQLAGVDKLTDRGAGGSGASRK